MTNSLERQNPVILEERGVLKLDIISPRRQHFRRDVRRGAVRESNIIMSLVWIQVKAFRGELVPTEAEVARREGRSYEPAAALLARIRAERESSAGSSHLRTVSFSEEPVTRRSRKVRSK